ncbi:hypothetical protein [Microbispora amethystogenes]|uniref:WXG100 family type VII secretion target n=1 Tax=Microbispora amethystogenes TaxID=1427754 RepID=A0ABQ4FBP9_9ACTN|nr:hypothetical protein [Microbispora amethystogenes]GIH32251.1 hypothetical protein Mam01_24150 [Microbispora amethystogenes]
MANPEYRDLQTVLALVREHAGVLETSLDQVCALFGGHPVWVGSTARAFGEELNGRRLRMKATIQHLVAELEAELRATPARISRAIPSGRPQVR